MYPRRQPENGSGQALGHAAPGPSAAPVVARGRRRAVVRRPVRSVPVPVVVAVVVALALVAAGCGGGAGPAGQASSDGVDGPAASRSSGTLAVTRATSDPAARVGGTAAAAELRNLATDGADGADGTADIDGTDGGEEDGDAAQPVATGTGFVPPARPDGIELVYADGALGPAVLGSTIDEIAEALGPLYTVTPEPFVRAGFGPGYSISSEGEVLFWAIEEAGVVTVLMSTSPRVGLDSGLRPKLPLAEAVALHGEPQLSLGPEGREFASFEDGTGGVSAGPADGRLSVLVAVGEFGGPVGVYDDSTGTGIGATTVAYQPEDANIKELWFWAG